MREMFIFTILFLFCFIPVEAQEVPFEGLHLDDLISVPGERQPGTFNRPSIFPDLPDFKLHSSDKLLFPYTSRLPLLGLIPVHIPRMHNLNRISISILSDKLTIHGDYLSSGSFPMETYSAYSIHSDTELRCKLANKLSFGISTHYISDRYHTLRSLYARGVGVGINYQLSDKFLLKSGVSYQYNTVFRKWEWMYLTGLIFCF